MRLYVGSYANETSEGIHLLELDLSTGKLTKTRGAAGVANPSFLALHPNGRFLYAVGETGHFRGKNAGAVAAFAIDPDDGSLKLLNDESSGGAAPCHLVVDKHGKHVLVANYSGGSVCCLPVGDDGRLRPASSFIQHHGHGPNRQRQEGPHAHSVNLDGANRFAFVADLGLDQILVYRFDAASGKLTPNDPPAASLAAGSGPRHFAFHPGGRYAYVINELKSTVTAFKYDAQRGVLEEVQTLTTLPDDSQGENTTAEVQVHPSGKFVYGSNRGHDSIAIFTVDQERGKLTPVGHESTQGKTPRNFGIDPSGKFLLAANQDSDSIVVFQIDSSNGKLTSTGHKLELPKPVCVKFVSE